MTTQVWLRNYILGFFCQFFVKITKYVSKYAPPGKFLLYWKLDCTNDIKHHNLLDKLFFWIITRHISIGLDCLEWLAFTSLII